MEVTRRPGAALWRQIQERLEDEIAAGVLRTGSRAPAEHALARRFGVNRHTVRRAIAALAEKGLVRVQQGRGTFVREAVIDYPVRKRTRFRENISGQASAPAGVLLSSDTVPATATIAQALDTAVDEPVLMLRALRSADARPVALTDHYFLAQRFPALIEAYRVHGSITAALSACGISDYTRRSTRVTARMPDRDEAALLDQPANRPVLVTVSVNLDADDRPLEYGVSRFAADRVHLLFEP